MERKIKAVLFDFDGTLVDTNQVIIESFQATYEKYYGHRVDEKKIISVFGEQLLNTMEREFPQDPQGAVDFYRDYQHKYADKLVRGFPGMPELLAELKKREYELIIVTSRTTESTRNYLEAMNISQYFPGIVSCEDTIKHKPNPEPILCALERLNRKPEDAIMVGDGPFDMLCASNAGVRSVLVGWRITELDNPLCPNAKCDYEIAKPMDLIKILEELC